MVEEGLEQAIMAKMQLYLDAGLEQVFETWDNIRKRGFHGPSICVMCGTNEEDSSHLFFCCSFALQLWHFWWEVWAVPCVHASSLTEFWQKMGRPPSMAPFL